MSKLNFILRIFLFALILDMVHIPGFLGLAGDIRLASNFGSLPASASQEVLRLPALTTNCCLLLYEVLAKAEITCP